MDYYHVNLEEVNDKSALRERVHISSTLQINIIFMALALVPPNMVCSLLSFFKYMYKKSHIIMYTKKRQMISHYAGNNIIILDFFALQ